MTLMRSERVAAVLLLLAATLGLLVANSPAGEQMVGLRDRPFEISALAFQLSAGDLIKDGLLAIFFFIAAIELRHELTRGSLNSPRKALVPTIAAIGGVIIPGLIFLAIVHDPELVGGWPIPTATDVAFALGVLAIVGKHLPKRVRALLLALAVIDDLIAIIIIGFFFTDTLNPLPLLLAVPVILLFGWLSLQKSHPAATTIALIVLGITTWLLVLASGIHPTIAGVALGLIMAPDPATHARRSLEPVSNLIVLPLFAFTAALVVIPQIGISELSPVFWAILVALPVGKIVGISIGGLIASLLTTNRSQRVPFANLLVVASLGGIGFTVSLLMNELAYENNRLIAVEGTLAVLASSVLSLVIGGSIGAARSNHYRRRQNLSPSNPR